MDKVEYICRQFCKNSFCVERCFDGYGCIRHERYIGEVTRMLGYAADYDRASDLRPKDGE